MTSQKMTELVRTKYCNHLVSKIAGFKSNDDFCDVDVNIDGEVFKCHRLVLSGASEYFYKMFSGMFKESSMTQVTLQGIEVNIFGEILRFMYTGEAVIQTTNVLDMIRQADFYNLPLMFELCTKFVEENLNALAEEILNIYSLAHRVGLIQLIELLREHIHQNFCYFSRRPEFSKLTYDSFIEVINLIKAERMVAHDVFLEGICTWIRHQENLTLVERQFYFNSLTKKINFAKLSVEYTQYRIKTFMAEVVLPSQRIDGDVNASNAVQRPIRSLHAYVSRNSEDGLSCGTSIFTLHLTGGPNKTYTDFIWVYSGELGYPVDYMRNVHVDDRLYSLRYKYLCENGSQQTFQCGSLISMYPSMTLKPPPFILDEYDLCGMLNNIYVYNKNIPTISNDTAETFKIFSEEDLSHGMYVYQRDIDVWFPIPRPKTRFVNSCMTCDDQVVYLIGGSRSNKSVQAFDPRTQGWFSVPSTAGIYDGAACCAYDKKIYVAGDKRNTNMLEIYDPISGRWQHVKDLGESRTHQHQLVNGHLPDLEDAREIISFNRTLSANSSIISLDTVDDNWFSLPDLLKDASNTYPTFTNFCILDMINF